MVMRLGTDQNNAASKPGAAHGTDRGGIRMAGTDDDVNGIAHAAANAAIGITGYDEHDLLS